MKNQQKYVIEGMLLKLNQHTELKVLIFITTFYIL